MAIFLARKVDIYFASNERVIRIHDLRNSRKYFADYILGHVFSILQENTFKK